MIFGPICIEGEWRTRYNSELYHMYKDVPIVRKIKAQRLRWLGHVARMDENDVAKSIFESKPQGGNRGRGRSQS